MFDDLPLTPPPPVASPAGQTASVDGHRALYLRFRPRRFADVRGQDHVTRTLRNAVRASRPAHAYLFTGPRGTGKTSVARILYRAVNCEQPTDGDPCNACALCRAGLNGSALDLVEIDAASTGGVSDIRDLREKVGYRPNDGRYRVYIIDEAHEMSTAAWDALLKTLEEPPPHAMFVLATTEAHKVPPTIISRCQRFDFRRIPFDVTRGQLADVAAAEGMQIEPTVLERLALVARGGLRDALSLLDQLRAFATADTVIDMQVARAALSLPSIEAVRGLIEAMTQRDAGGVMRLLSDAVDGGADMRLLTEDLVTSVRALLLLASQAGAGLSETLPEAELAWLRERAPFWSPGALMRLIRTLSESLARTRDAQQFQVQVEVALLAACEIETRGPLSPQASAPTPPVSGTTLAPQSGPHAATPAGGASSASASPPAAAPTGGDAGAKTVFSNLEPAAAPTGGDAGAKTVSSNLDTPRADLPAGGASSASPSQPASAPTAGEARATSVFPNPDTRGASSASASQPAGAPTAGDSEPATVFPKMGADASAVAYEPRTLAARWPDVIDVVKGRNPVLASLLGSASPSHVDENLLVVLFSTEFNKKRAESASARQLIESAFERVYGTAYRLRCSVRSDADSGPNLLEDPVINYATRTFGGQPRRLA